MDIGRSFAIKATMNEAKFDALEQYLTSPLFTDAERAALAVLGADAIRRRPWVHQKTSPLGGAG